MKPSGLSEFLAMGGYGFYVWTSYIIAAVAIVLEIVAVRARMRAATKSASRSDHAIILPDDTQ
jgi:heme exporter protein D